MARFCSNHCGERTIPELEERQAELQQRPYLSPHLQAELRRVQDTLQFKRLMAGDEEQPKADLPEQGITRKR